ncbi:MAG: SBBP repeat-containing protein, partial [Propionibacteriaceae bacterium]|nr:SBBP repeat-containing protein [Propionibacteriaceae bacterium]
MAACRRAWLSVLVVVGLGLAGSARAQVQAWATRYDSGPVVAQDARPGAGDQILGKRALALDSAGNSYVTGTIGKGSDTDCLTVKYDASGAVVWSVTHDSGSADYCFALALDGSGGLYVTVSYQAVLKYDTTNGSQQWSRAPGGTALAWDGNGIVVGGSYFVAKWDAAGTQLWYRPSSTTPYAIRPDASGNVYVGGYESNGANYDYSVRKYDSGGTLQWARLYNGPGNNYDYAYDIGVDGAGSVYATGWCHNGSDYDACTVKYDAAGTQQWVRAYHAGGDTAYAIAVDATGNAHVTGSSYLGAATGSDYLTIKYDSAGTQQWAALHHGGFGYDYAYAIELDGAGNAYVTGTSPQGASGQDFRTVKYSPTGAQLWAVSYGVAPNRVDSAYAIARDGAGNLLVAGESRETSNNESYQYRVVKYDGGGTQQWAATNPAVVIDPDDRPLERGMAVDGAGNTYVLGRSYNGKDWDYKTVKHDPTGAVAWARTYSGPGGYDEPRALALDASGNVYVTGTSSTSSSGGAYRYLTIKYDPAGVQQWAVADAPEGYAWALAVDGAGNVYVTGESPSGGPTGWDYRTVKYNSAGVPQWAAAAGGLSSDRPQAIALDATGNVHVTGWTVSASQLDYRTVKHAAANGAPLWNVTYNGSGNGNDEPEAIAVDALGNVYVTGTSTGSGSTGDFLTIKYDAGGVQQWAVPYSGSGNYWDFVSDLAVDGSGNVYVTGASIQPATGSDFATIKYDTAGTQLWAATHSFGGGDGAVDLALDAAGNAYVTGYAYPTSSNYQTVKLDGNGVEQWAVTFDAPGNREDRGAGAAVDATGSVYVTGHSRDGEGYDFVTIKYTPDTTAPTNATVSSTSHTASTWSNVGTLAMQWSGAADDSGGIGLKGYSRDFDTNVGTTPDTTVDTPHGSDPHSASSGLLADGNSHYFHLRTCDLASNCSTAVHAGPYWIDRTNPGAPPSLSSTSHTPSTPSGDRTIDIQWDAASDPLSNGVASGVDGYSYFFDGNAGP